MWSYQLHEDSRQPEGDSCLWLRMKAPFCFGQDSWTQLMSPQNPPGQRCSLFSAGSDLCSILRLPPQQPGGQKCSFLCFHSQLHSQFSTWDAQSLLRRPCRVFTSPWPAPGSVCAASPTESRTQCHIFWTLPGMQPVPRPDHLFSEDIFFLLSKLNLPWSR